MVGGKAEAGEDEHQAKACPESGKHHLHTIVPSAYFLRGEK
nr:unnamed protein product [Digitaria exilis]